MHLSHLAFIILFSISSALAKDTFKSRLWDTVATMAADPHRAKEVMEVAREIIQDEMGNLPETLMAEARGRDGMDAKEMSAR